MAPKDTQGQVSALVAETAEAAQGKAISWNKEVNNMRANQALYNHKLKQQEVAAMAEEDPDPNNAEKYKKMIIDSQKQLEVGFTDPWVAAEIKNKLTYETGAANILIDHSFKKKLIEQQQVTTQESARLLVTNPATTLDDINALWDADLSKKLFSAQALDKLKLETIKSATEEKLNREMVMAASSEDQGKIKEFADSLPGREVLGKKLTSEMVASFTDKVYRMAEKIKSQNQRDMFVTSADNMKQLVENTLTSDQINRQVADGKMSPEMASIWKASQLNPDQWNEAVDSKTIKPASGSANVLIDIVNSIADGKSDVSKTQVLELALKQYNAKKINKSDVAWVLRTITGKDETPESPIWNSLKSAFALGGPGMVKQFMSVWNFKQDPKKVMAGLKRDQAKTRFKNVNLTDNEPDSVVDAFNLVHDYSIPTSSAKDDEGDTIDPYDSRPAD